MQTFAQQKAQQRELLLVNRAEFKAFAWKLVPTGLFFLSFTIELVVTLTLRNGATFVGLLGFAFFGWLSFKYIRAMLSSLAMIRENLRLIAQSEEDREKERVQFYDPYADFEDETEEGSE
jgi:hypothetical protein